MSASPVLASPVRIPPCLADTPLFWLALGGLGIWLGFPNDVCSVPPLVLLWPVSLVVLGMRATYGYDIPHRDGVLLERALPSLRMPFTGGCYTEF